MDIKLFGWAFKHKASETAGTAQPAPCVTAPSSPQPPCPPCTGRCFQGRACPSSPSADPVLVALLRRSPLQ